MSRQLLTGEEGLVAVDALEVSHLVSNLCKVIRVVKLNNG